MPAIFHVNAHTVANLGRARSHKGFQHHIPPADKPTAFYSLDVIISGGGLPSLGEALADSPN